ncbi:hypothetical protein [Bradyrhizobium sp. Ai1a-2]|uniref:hypothetical protein n=1 Tax=Bradyrhizobium sp. Ai1a-2 TaxID=196490 RepID=UPI001269492E|nr:hypothetical protein [Bradyrhizobium sp. Ai1a-2]
MSETEAASKTSFSTPEWLKSLGEMPIKLFVWTSKEALRLAASCLQDQVTYLKGLAGCTTPSEALKYQLESAQQILDSLDIHSRSSNKAAGSIRAAAANGSPEQGSRVSSAASGRLRRASPSEKEAPEPSRSLEHENTTAPRVKPT